MSLDTRKRQRRGTSEDKHLGSDRNLRHSRAFEGRNDDLDFIHAVEVASLEAKCVPVMGAQKEDVAIELQYPSMQPREKYVLHATGSRGCRSAFLFL
jgi:H3 lysine-79-specific histone-lysine N-methyltransferase